MTYRPGKTCTLALLVVGAKTPAKGIGGAGRPLYADVAGLRQRDWAYPNRLGLRRRYADGSVGKTRGAD